MENINIYIDSIGTCPLCCGSRSNPQNILETCPRCKGEGTIKIFTTIPLTELKKLLKGE